MSYDRSDGDARSKAFGQRHDVGQNPRPLMRKPATSPRRSALNFINHQ